MAKKKKGSQEVFYVSIQDPIELRRSLLESSKEMLQLLKRNEKFKEVRKEKKENILQLKEDLKDIKKLFAKLRNNLPLTHLRVILRQEKERADALAAEERKHHKVKKPSKKKEVAKQKPKEAKVSHREMDDLDKLEKELASIEGKLSTMV
tara:strand:- start:776 stop:1225 length:450 start_codon:yes stop_codon:yes gene_type:complete